MRSIQVHIYSNKCFAKRPFLREVRLASIMQAPIHASQLQMACKSRLLACIYSCNGGFFLINSCNWMDNSQYQVHVCMWASAMYGCPYTSLSESESSAYATSDDSLGPWANLTGFSTGEGAGGREAGAVGVASGGGAVGVAPAGCTGTPGRWGVVYQWHAPQPYIQTEPTSLVPSCKNTLDKPRTTLGLSNVSPAILDLGWNHHILFSDFVSGEEHKRVKPFISCYGRCITLCLCAATHSAPFAVATLA